jgi:DivIVA domain-containing protein
MNERSSAVTTHGGRFRRRALRRGYKVDEVDTFLDRVEATLAGEPVEIPVTAQEVHDVVFRVRFGGYDEWQVDLHLDRVERQLGELAEQGPAVAGGPAGYGGGPGAPGAGMGPGGPGGGMGPGGPGYGRGPEHAPAGHPAAHPPPLPQRPTPASGGPGVGAPGPYGEPPRHFEGERYHADMTTEMRMGEYGGPAPEAPPPPHRPAGPPPAGPPPAGPPPAGPPHGGHPMAGPPPGPGGRPGPAPAPTPGPMGGAAPSDLQRVDQLRRGFQPRRFGSGYDRAQVDQLFEELIHAMSGRGPMSVGEAQLDPRRFDLVAGGYFEAEVDHALNEVREILRRS